MPISSTREKANVAVTGKFLEDVPIDVRRRTWFVHVEDPAHSSTDVH